MEKNGENKTQEQENQPRVQPQVQPQVWQEPQAPTPERRIWFTRRKSPVTGRSRGNRTR